MGFFEDIEEEDISQSVSNMIIKDVIACERKRVFDETISVEAYIKRGMIKEGDLMLHPEDLFNYKGMDVEFLQTENNWNLQLFNDSEIIGAPLIEDEDMSKTEIAAELIKCLEEDKLRGVESPVTIYVVGQYIDDNEYSPIKGGKQYVEFKGCYQFVNNRGVWNLRKYHKAMYLIETENGIEKTI